VLNKEENIVTSVSEFPNLLKYLHEDIVFTDGNTLLGADDKSAISELLAMANYLLNHPEEKHGDIRIAFTPDEEVGGLAEHLDFARFGADIAYTVDGDYVGYYSDETFNAIEAQLTITGKNVHPGTAKGIMKNAVEIGCEFIAMLPGRDRPQFTEGREGFYHPHVFSGNVEKAEVLTLIRDHDEDSFNQRKQYIIECVDKLNAKYGENTVSLKYANGYFSMKKVVDQVPYMIDDLVEAIKSCGIEPYHLAFRGGTDGSSISQRGLPCPNISAGYENAHSRHEFVSIQAMVKTTEILIELCRRLSLR
ncbi:MAG: peptidase T, partial [Erysipelotrichaceae bacterium]|nr:peptidase T [Erysipelotrichaceae bacterium]